jgi:hypothetical protein
MATLEFGLSYERAVLTWFDHLPLAALAGELAAADGSEHPPEATG